MRNKRMFEEEEKEEEEQEVEEVQVFEEEERDERGEMREGRTRGTIGGEETGTGEMVSFCKCAFPISMRVVDYGRKPCESSPSIVFLADRGDRRDRDRGGDRHGDRGGDRDRDRGGDRDRKRRGEDEDTEIAEANALRASLGLQPLTK